MFQCYKIKVKFKGIIYDYVPRPHNVLLIIIILYFILGIQYITFVCEVTSGSYNNNNNNSIYTIVFAVQSYLLLPIYASYRAYNNKIYYYDTITVTDYPPMGYIMCR